MSKPFEDQTKRMALLAFPNINAPGVSVYNAVPMDVPAERRGDYPMEARVTDMEHGMECLMFGDWACGTGKTATAARRALLVQLVKNVRHRAAELLKEADKTEAWLAKNAEDER